MKNFRLGTRGFVLALLALGYFLILTVSGVAAQTSRGADVASDALPKELSQMDIKDYFLPSSLKKVGVIHALNGNVVIIHKKTKQAYFGRPGDSVYENDSLNTLAGSRCRLKFIDEDVITMASNTEFSIDKVDEQRKLGIKDSSFSMLKGKAKFYALRLFRHKTRKFKLRTPTVVVGIRGTKFGASVYWEEEKRTDRGMLVADSNDDMGVYLAQLGSNETGQSFTDAFSEDGVLDVNGQIVGPGEMFMGKTGKVVPTPPEVIRTFDQETEVKTEEELAEEKKEEEKAPEAEEEEVTPDTGEETGQQTAADQTENLGDITQEEVATQTENVNTSAGAASSVGDTVKDRPTSFFGYFSALLTDTTSTNSLQDVFLSTSRQDFNSSSVQGFGVIQDNDFLKGQDRFSGTPTLTDAKVIGTEVNNLNRTITSTEIGHNQFQEWGSWTMTTSFTVDSNDYVIDNKGYYIFGENTPDSAVAGLSSLGSVGYSGDAFGTYWTDTGGTDMTGTFSCTVDFNSPAVSNFDLSVSGGSKAASIQDATGSFSSSQFTIDAASGTWSLTPGGTPPSTQREAYGSLYGDKAQKIGGVWGMKVDSTNGAQGIFMGDR